MNKYRIVHTKPACYKIQRKYLFLWITVRSLTNLVSAKEWLTDIMLVDAPFVKRVVYEAEQE
jgi:hypothetical protein